MKVIPDCHCECNAKALISALRDKGEEAILRGYMQELASLVLNYFPPMLNEFLLPTLRLLFTVISLEQSRSQKIFFI